MSKILEDHGDIRISRNGQRWYARELVLDCGCTIEINLKDMYDALNSDLLIKLRIAEHKCETKSLTVIGSHEISINPEEHCQEHNVKFGVCSPAHLVPGMYYRPEPSDEIKELQRLLLAAQQEAGKWKDKYDHLNNIYCKLADQWNAFQATSRPDNRNVHRAEAAGEVTRKMAEVFMALAYDHDAFDLIATLLEMLRELQQGGAGRTVEVSERLVPHRG